MLLLRGRGLLLLPYCTTARLLTAATARTAAAAVLLLLYCTTARLLLRGLPLLLHSCYCEAATARLRLRGCSPLLLRGCTAATARLLLHSCYCEAAHAATARTATAMPYCYYCTVLLHGCYCEDCQLDYCTAATARLRLRGCNDEEDPFLLVF